MNDERLMQEPFDTTNKPRLEQHGAGSSEQGVRLPDSLLPAGYPPGGSVLPFVRAALLCLILAAVAVRLLHWPAQHDLRDGDELPYAWGSLQLLEGNLPGLHFSPAGPQTWIGWLYESAISLKNLAVPDSVESKAPLQLRPFLAIQHSLFDSYRDAGALRQVWVLTSFIVAIGGVLAGFRLGLDKAGMAGAVLMGGTMAILPLFVDLSVQARPYSVAWSFGAIALYYALAAPANAEKLKTEKLKDFSISALSVSAFPWGRRKAFTISAIVMGLAVGSRIDMLMLLPVIWSEAWQRSREENTRKENADKLKAEKLKYFSISAFQLSAFSFLRTMLYYHAVFLATFVIVAPWFLMTFAACLREVATVRLGAGLAVAKPAEVFFQVIWEQGMLLYVPLFLLGVAEWVMGKRRRWLLALYVLLAGFSILKSPASAGLRHHGAPLLLVALGALYGLRLAGRQTEKLRDFSISAFSVSVFLPVLSLLCLVLPAVQTCRLVYKQRGNYVPDLSTEWVETHVPAGTILYVQPWMFNALPTAKAADADWAELADNSAYQRKFKAVMRRFELDADEIPRALSEVNLALERANHRGQFILGARHWAQIPRYDTRIFNLGPVFGVRDLSAAFGRTGGVVVLRGPPDDPLAKGLGEPVKEWLSPSGYGTRVYCSPDVASRLK
jgi:hypothetical protein